MIERRALVRHKSLIKGRIYFNNRLSSMDCIVRDVTDKGARLEFSENVALPDVFELYMPNKDEYFQAHVEWRKGNNLGISWRAEYVSGSHGDDAQADFPLADRVRKLEHDVAVLQKRLDSLRDA